MSETLHRAWEHVAWANERVASVLEGCVDDERAREAIRLFTHIVATEAVWLQRIRGEPPTKTPWPEPDLERDVRSTTEHLSHYRAIIADDDLTRQVTYHSTEGGRYETRLSDIVLHVALHGAYHRGQIAWVLRREGLEPTSTDLVMLERREERA